MKRIMFILGMVFIMCGFFVGCKESSPNVDSIRELREGVSPDKLEPITITLTSVLRSNHKVKIQSGYEEDVLLSTGQCVRIEGTTQEKLVVSTEQDNVTSQLCSNIDDDKNNDCKGSYNVFYKPADSKTGANKLALESTDRNESERCIMFPPVYTITLVSDLGTRTVKVQNKKMTKTLKEKGSCVKLKIYDFFDLQIDVGEGDENRKILCSDRKQAGDEVVSAQCYKEEEEEDYFNIEIGISGVPPVPSAVKLNKEVEYNHSKNCKWFNDKNAEQ